MREWLRYDAVLKDLFQRDHPTLLRKLTGGRAIRQTLNVELAMVEERRADLLFELEDGSLLLLDFQSNNDRGMPHRVGMYTLLAAQKYRRPVQAVVLYAGREPLRMSADLDAGSAKVQYRLLDIREFEARELLLGGPGDLVLALLAKGGRERMHEIIAKALQFRPPGRDRILTQLVAMAGLRRLDKTIKMEMEHMGAYIDIQKNVILRDIWDGGIAEGLARGKTEGKAEGALDVLTGMLESRFGPLPQRTKVRLRKATSEQIVQWSLKILTAPTLEAVIGRR